MSTGYTYIVEDRDDTTFEQYLWRCARGFGAFVMQRDSSLDAAVPLECRPDGYYEKRVRECRERLRVAEEMTPDAAVAAMAEENRQRLAWHEEEKVARETKTARYDRMREKVLAWCPPTPEHEGLKKFMLEQLDTGWPDYWREPEEPPIPATDPAAWRAKKVEEARESLARAEKRLAEELECCEKATAWIQALNKQTPWVPQPKEKG